MSIWPKGTMTKAGLLLQAKLTKGTTLDLTRAVVGTGYVPEPDLPFQTGVIGEKSSLYFQPIKIFEDTATVTVPVLLENSHVTVPYKARQLGFYAKDPDAGEILYCICQVATEEDGDEVPTATEMPGFSIEWNVSMGYGNADTVNVTFDPAGLLTQITADNRYYTKIEINNMLDALTSIVVIPEGQDIPVSERKKDTYYFKVMRSYTIGFHDNYGSCTYVAPQTQEPVMGDYSIWFLVEPEEGQEGRAEAKPDVGSVSYVTSQAQIPQLYPYGICWVLDDDIITAPPEGVETEPEAGSGSIVYVSTLHDLPELVPYGICYISD